MLSGWSLWDKCLVDSLLDECLMDKSLLDECLVEKWLVEKWLVDEVWCIPTGWIPMDECLMDMPSGEMLVGWMLNEHAYWTNAYWTNAVWTNAYWTKSVGWTPDGCIPPGLSLLVLDFVQWGLDHCGQCVLWAVVQRTLDSGQVTTDKLLLTSWCVCLLSACFNSECNWVAISVKWAMSYLSLHPGLFLMQNATDSSYFVAGVCYSVGRVFLLFACLHFKRKTWMICAVEVLLTSSYTVTVTPCSFAALIFWWISCF